MKKDIIKRTLRVPAVDTISGNGQALTRQLDVALMEVGFKLSGNLFRHFSNLHPSVVKEMSETIISAVQELVGVHVRHNVYFIDFPLNVPDTTEFWMACIIDALIDPSLAEKISLQLSVGSVNLLDLPKYGQYQHTYEELVEAHEKFIPSAKDRVTILHLGCSLQEEAFCLYNLLAASTVPLNEYDRKVLQELAECCVNDPQPEEIPVRENKAVINQARINVGMPILADTVTDILRLSCLMSDGDVTLTEKTRFKSFSRKTRKELLSALDGVIEKSPIKLADVNRFSERWKRLGERLHAGDYKRYTHAQDVFKVARGDKRVHTLEAQVEAAFKVCDNRKAIDLMAKKPGLLFRSLDRIMRRANMMDWHYLLNTVEAVISEVSFRVILSVREHFLNRVDNLASSRIFANSKGTVWVDQETRKTYRQDAIDSLFRIFDAEIARRLPEFSELVVDSRVLDLAIPVSEKNKASGFGILPRGSQMNVKDGIIRFFMHWKQQCEVTDYDLSALMLDENFGFMDQLSWTNLESEDGIHVHSGDITNAPDGASEFIDINLGKACCKYVIPTVYVFSGEDFQTVEESFFGFMERDPEQEGMPFEPATVRVKSELRGKGKVALPLVFIRNDDGSWSAKWLHLYLNGAPAFNRVEKHTSISAHIARSVIERKYLGIDYLLEQLMQKADKVSYYESGQEFSDKAAFIGLEAPEGLPEGSSVYTLANMQELIPA